MSHKPEFDFKSFSIKKEFAEKLEAFIKTHPELGYRSVAQFLEDSSRRRYEELLSQIKEPPRFEQINIDENGTKILDRKIREVVNVYIYSSFKKRDRVVYRFGDVLVLAWGSKRYEGYRGARHL